MKKIISLCLGIFCLIFLVQAYASKNPVDNKKLDLDTINCKGKILWESFDCINYVDLESNIYDYKTLYTNKKYQRLENPFKIQDNMFYKEYIEMDSIKDNIINIIKLNKNKKSIILSTNENLFYPTSIDGKNFFYIIYAQEDGILKSYSLESNTEKILINHVKVNKFSVSSNGDILFTGNDDIIKIMNKNGEVRNIVKGQYPLWLEEGKKIIYVQNDSINILDIETNKVNIIQKNVTPLNTPAVSPDKKYIAFLEEDLSKRTVGDCQLRPSQLSVMRINDGEKVKIPALTKDSELKDLYGDILWIP